jgi:hypothetical protein
MLWTNHWAAKDAFRFLGLMLVPAACGLLFATQMKHAIGQAIPKAPPASTSNVDGEPTAAQEKPGKQEKDNESSSAGRGLPMPGTTPAAPIDPDEALK